MKRKAIADRMPARQVPASWLIGDEHLKHRVGWSLRVELEIEGRPWLEGACPFEIEWPPDPHDLARVARLEDDERLPG